MGVWSRFDPWNHHTLSGELSIIILVHWNHGYIVCSFLQYQWPTQRTYWDRFSNYRNTELVSQSELLTNQLTLSECSILLLVEGGSWDPFAGECSLPKWSGCWSSTFLVRRSSILKDCWNDASTDFLSPLQWSIFALSKYTLRKQLLNNV